MRLTTLLLVLLLVAEAAEARNTDHVLPVQEAVQSELGRERLLPVPFYFLGQESPPVQEEIATIRSNRHTSGVFRTDQSACQIAFLSALIQLQARAQKEHADAIVEIISVTRNQNLSSPTEYRCIAGGVVVHVGLEGKLVRLKP